MAPFLGNLSQSEKLSEIKPPIIEIFWTFINFQLYLCESNAKSPYWPINGIQCNTYEDWMEQGCKNGYNVVWAPLDRQLGY